MAPMSNKRITDPRGLPVQLNVQIPWSFREFLIEQAELEGLSLAKLVKRVLMAEYGTAWRRMEMTYEREQQQQPESLS